MVSIEASMLCSQEQVFAQAIASDDILDPESSAGKIVVSSQLEEIISGEFAEIATWGIDKYL